MREHDRLGTELRHLAVHFEHEVAQFEREDKGGAPARKILMVSGADYPRFDAHDNGPVWKLQNGPRILRDKNNGTLDPSSGCLLPEEKKIRVDLKVPEASLWRQRALRLAAWRLRTDPTLLVYLYDLDLGRLDLITQKGGKLEAFSLRRFRPLSYGDYRMVTEVGGKKVLQPIPTKNLAKSKFPERPSIRCFPSVSALGAGDVDHKDWIDKIASDAGWWLKDYRKRADRNRLLTVLDVYRDIERIGRKEPYTLQEFHLWGHASSSATSKQSGTVFVNTDPLYADERHPLDLDARAGVDFTAKTIDQKHFRMAFAKGATSTVWGCNADTAMRKVITYAKQSLGGQPLVDDAKLRFDLTARSDHPFIKSFEKILEVTPKDKSDRIERTGKWFRERLISILDATYMQKLADASSRCVLGAVPGTGSDYDQKNLKGEPCLSHVSMGRLYLGDVKDPSELADYTGVMEFYRVNLAVPFHKQGAHPKFGRGYALYCPKTLPAKP